MKKAELTLTASMNRFQVTGTKFVKVIWKDGKKTEAEQWCTTWLAKDENKGKSSAEAWAAFKADAAGSTARHGTASLTLPNRPA